MIHGEGWSGGFGDLLLKDRKPPDFLPLQASEYRLHHVGILVRDLDETLATFQGLFGVHPVGSVMQSESMHVRTVFVSADATVLIELIEAETHSPVREVFRAVGEPPVHLCFEVEEMEPALADLRRRECVVLGHYEVRGSMAFESAFVRTPDGQIVEICRSGSGPDVTS